MEPLISQVKAFLRPAQKRDASIVPTAPFSNSTTDSNASSTSTLPPGRFSTNVFVSPETEAISLPSRKPREVDHVGAEIAERARARSLAVEPPDQREVGVHDPLLQVRATEVVELAELARLKQLPSEADGGDEAVVERAHVLDSRARDALPGLVALLGRAPERLLAEHVLAGLRRGDRRLCVETVRAAVVEELDALVRDELAPVGDVAVEAVAARRLGHRLSLRPATATRRGTRGGGQVMYESVLYAFE